MRNENLIFLFLNQNICCGYSKEPSQWDGSFEHPKHMLKLMGKKIFTVLHWIFLFIWTCEYNLYFSALTLQDSNWDASEATQIGRNIENLSPQLKFFSAYSKTCLKNSHTKKDRKVVFKTNYSLMQVKSIAECSLMRQSQQKVVCFSCLL